MGRMGRLQSKIALVTGGASGIGAACARAFVREGAEVLVTDVQDEAGAALLAELGEAASYRHLDVTRREDWDAAVAMVRERHGRLHVLVHNAGGGAAVDIERVTLEQWRGVQALNVESVLLGTQAALPLMRACGEPGSIVVMSSVAGLIGEPGLVAYGAAKAAVRMMAKSIALHCARKGDRIRCNSIHPSFTDTPLVRSLAGQSKDPDKALQRLAQAAPVGRLAEPEEVAALVLYLASDESAFVTGTELVIDGGLTAT
ncbi:glucose 1-dehydrogenase [Paraliomyxa miuraensis]|uniref:glucose 1-dehydrogenase n=1 Tax=Paraliomyxa miuraensis TaxID=376150 RepID=UPI002252F875|nr:glucose 1-dehydrogenase [Paraliomyxa miuraensis]MCX4240004.1 glucose 1-dehydrogenase [Paraliomyxa miuraensis]